MITAIALTAGSMGSRFRGNDSERRAHAVGHWTAWARRRHSRRLSLAAL